MTRKDYVLLAEAISATRKRIHQVKGPSGIEQLRGVRRTAAAIADALAKENPAFDMQRFLTACGYGA